MARIERLFGSLEIRLREHRRQLQRVLVVDESVFGDGVGRKADRQIIVEEQQLAQGVRDTARRSGAGRGRFSARGGGGQLPVPA